MRLIGAPAARWRVWLACLAATLGLAAPGSGVAGHAHAGNWQEICTAGGSRFVSVADHGLPAGAVQAADDCACCVAGASALLPLRIRYATPAERGRDLLPVARGVQVTHARVWARGRPRAPPPVFV
jgi:hypothetical protein